MSKFQDNLRTYREQLGINAKEFAAQLGLPYTKYIAYENKGVEPKYDTLIKIAAALHVSIDDLIGYEADKLGYWLERFPSIPLFADIDESTENVVISTMNDKGCIKLLSLSKADFIRSMEWIKQEAEKEVSANNKKMFGLLTTQHFLEKAFWNDNLLDFDEAERQIQEQESMYTQKGPAE